MAARLLAAAALAPVAFAARSKPDVVLAVVDDLGYGDLGITGHPSTRTPHIDALARRGRQLRTWYSAAAVCSASRTAILTGRQPPRVGMVGVLNSMSIAGLPLTETTLADDLRAAGYATLALGTDPGVRDSPGAGSRRRRGSAT